MTIAENMALADNKGKAFNLRLEPTNSAWNSTANLSAPLALDWKIKWT